MEIVLIVVGVAVLNVTRFSFYEVEGRLQQRLCNASVVAAWGVEQLAATQFRIKGSFPGSQKQAISTGVPPGHCVVMQS